MLPFAAYGQGPVLVSPFKMARVAATIAAGGQMPRGPLDGRRQQYAHGCAGATWCAESQAAFLAGAMRRVVTEGTARRAMAGSDGRASRARPGRRSSIAGCRTPGSRASRRTTALPERRLAFAVLVEHGGYGGAVAAPIAREVMEAAKAVGIAMMNIT